MSVAHSFLKNHWVIIFYVLCIPWFLYPFIWWWGLGLFPLFSYYKQSCFERLYVYEHILSFLLGKFPGMEWLHSIVDGCLCRKLLNYFSKWLSHFTFPLVVHSEFVPLDPCHIIMVSLFKISVILIGVKWDCIVIFICISLMTDAAECHFMSVFAICVCSVVK